MTDLRGLGSRALVAGAGSFAPGSLLPGVSSVAATVTDIAECLRTECGMAGEQVSVLLDPPDPEALLDAFLTVCQEATDVLLLYYVGHGALTQDGELHLATAATVDLRTKAAYQALPFRELAAAVRQSRARHVVVVLDCCFSGRAGLVSANGAVLTSSGRDEHALAVPGDTHTLFSGEFLAAIRNGVPTAPPNLTLQNVYEHLHAVQQAGHRPLPGLQVGNRAAAISLTTNRAYAAVENRVPDLFPATGGRCPYRGLEPYLTGDSELFFGRERVAERMVRRLALVAPAGGLMIVSGPSGAGKTSLINAGVIPAVGRGDLGLSGSAGWRVVSLTPLQGLAQLRAAIESDDDGARIVVIDQFEEVFAHADRDAYVSAVTSATGRSGGGPPITVVLVLRSDFTGHCAGFPSLASALENEHLVVGPMTGEELTAAIERPAEHAGLRVEPGLTAVLLRDMGFGPAGTVRQDDDPVALPLLSHALMVTWQRREGRVLTLAAYQAAGGVAAALASTAETTYHALDAAGQATAEALFVQMVSVSDGEPETRRRIALTSAADPQARGVLEEFARNRLVTLEQHHARLAHEALIGSWPRLRGWLEAHRTARLALQDLERAAAGWDTANRDPALLFRGSQLAAVQPFVAGADHEGLPPLVESFVADSFRHQRRGRRIRQGVIASLVMLLLVSIGTAGLAIRRGGDLNTRLNRANAELLAGQALTTLPGDPSAGATLALRAYAGYRGSPRIRQALAAAYTALGSRDADVDSGGVIRAADFSLDGNTALIVRLDGQVLVTSGLSTSQQTTWTIPGTTGTLGSFGLSPDGRWGVSFANDGEVAVWNVTSQRKVQQWTRPGAAPGGRYPETWSFSADGTRLVVPDPASKEGPRAEVYVIATGRLEATVPLDARSAQALDLSAWMPLGPDSVLIFSNDRARLVATKGHRIIREFPAGQFPVADGRRLVSCHDRDYVAQLALIDIATGRSTEAVSTVDTPCVSVEKSKMSADGLHLVEDSSLGTDRELRSLVITSLIDGSVSRTLAPARGVSDSGAREGLPDIAMTVGPDSQPRVLAAVGRDLVRFTVDRIPRLGHGATLSATEVLASDDGRWLVEGSDAGISVVERATGQERGWLSYRDHSRIGALYLTQNTLLGVQPVDDKDQVTLTMLRIPDLGDRQTFIVPGHPDGKLHLPSYTGDDDRFYAMRFGTVTIWNLRTRRAIGELQAGDPAENPDWLLSSLPIAADTSRDLVAIEDHDHNIQLWRAGQRKRISSISAGALGEDRSISFNDTSTELAATTSPVAVGIWDTRSGALKRRLTVPRGDEVVSFTSDGYLLTQGGNTDQTLRFWNPRTGQLAGSIQVGFLSKIWRTTGTRAFATGRGTLPYSFSLLADDWARALCAGAPKGHLPQDACPPG